MRASSTVDMSPLRLMITNMRVPSVSNLWWKSHVTALRDENVINGDVIISVKVLVGLENEGNILPYKPPEKSVFSKGKGARE